MNGPCDCPNCRGTGEDPDPFFGGVLGDRCEDCRGTGEDPNCDDRNSYYDDNDDDDYEDDL